MIWVPFWLHFRPRWHHCRYKYKVIFVGTPISKAPADYPLHPQRRNTVALTLPIRGPGAVICHRQLRSAPGPLCAPPERVCALCVPACSTPSTCTAPQPALHPNLFAIVCWFICFADICVARKGVSGQRPENRTWHQRPVQDFVIFLIGFWTSFL